MSDLNIATTVAQLPNIQGMAGAQDAHPEVRQLLAAQMAQEVLKDQTHQVQKAEKQEASEEITDERQGGGSRQGMPGRGRRRRLLAPEPEESPSQDPSPWVGHLINRKV